MKLKSLLIALVLLGFVATSQALTISNVNVTIPGSGFIATNLWSFPVNLIAGQSLILTQTRGFNFDTSDDCHPPVCGIPVVSVNGLSFLDTLQVLTFGQADDRSITTDEAHDWTLLGSAPGFLVYAGYADTAHSGPCPGSGCLPTPWSGSPGVIFQGSAFLGGPTGCVRPGFADCYDAGAIRITAIPEPIGLMLLGVGLIAMAFWGRHQRIWR